MPISSLPYLFFFFSIYLAITIFFVHGKCLDDQEALLLELKSELNFNSSYSTKLVHWNRSHDCCRWEGVWCDDSDHVVVLDLSGEIKNSSSLFGLRYLWSLNLQSNSLSGNVPNSIFQLQSLEQLSLSDNFFNGTFQLENIIQCLPNLWSLDLSRNIFSFQVTNTNSSMASCNSSVEYPSLISLDLSDNRISGPIPSWIWESRDLTYLNLSCNFFVEPQKPYQFPTNLDKLDLHSNQLKGKLPPLPQELSFADFSNNNFHSTIPTIYVNSFLYFLSLANNSLSGEIPTSLCNATDLGVLDLSLNNLTGKIPPCLLGNLTYLQVFNMKGNNIHGNVTDKFPIFLRALDLSDNNLGGKIPKSIAGCGLLQVLNIGYNNFDDHFPCTLPSSLRVLVLRSNRFRGELRCHKSWPNLQIVDISFNNFSGSLHPLNFSSWGGMILESDPHLRPNHSGDNFLKSAGDAYHDEVTLTMKGAELKLVKIWPDFTCIDFSSNNFHGEIPNAIGDLTSLYLLNLSHNALTGKIPISLGALTELESLDMSANHLRGRIPQEIAQLSFLSFLNLSHNELQGRIPNGRQFQTFSSDSFEGNKELCGFPLNRSCSSPPGTGIAPSESKDDEIEWEYVFAALGYAVGLGSIVWTLLCWRSFRERYFEKIEEVVDNIFYQRARRRRHERRVKMRNEVIRRHHQRG